MSFHSVMKRLVCTERMIHTLSGRKSIYEKDGPGIETMIHEQRRWHNVYREIDLRTNRMALSRWPYNR